MTNSWIAQVIGHLGVEVDVPFTATLGDGTKIEAMARVRGFGGPKGMLILSPAVEMTPAARRLGAEGYGYSVRRSLDCEGEFDLETTKEMFCDWGWSGDPSRAPNWLR